MKKYILAFIALSICLSSFAQKDKPCLLLTKHYVDKTSCSNQPWSKVEAMNDDDANIKAKQFVTDNSTTSPATKTIYANRFVIIFSNKKNYTTFKCFPMLYRCFDGASFEDCINKMEKAYLDYPDPYASKPTEVYRWPEKN